MSGGKSQETTVGYEYYAGAHFVLCHGPIDSIERVEVADRKVNFAGNSDVVLTIDSSGSMDTNDPDDLRIEAGKRFVDGMSPSARAAVVDFDSSATLLQALTTDRAALKTALDQIDSSGGTSLSAGVSTALDHLLDESNNPGRFIVLLTDGEGDWDSSLAGQAADNDVVIFTVGLGGGVDDTLLQSIADDTGGQYYKADIAEDIDPIFQAILVTASTIADSGMQGALSGGGTFTPPGIIQARARSPSLFGGKSREGGISGLVDFCLGFPTQPASSYLKARLGEYVPAYRGVVSAILRQCYLGNNPYLKPWKFRARRIYTRGEGDPQWYWEKAGWPSDHYTHGDMNPIHIIRECLTDPIWGRGLPESEIGPSFEAAADTLHDEGLGMSMLWTKESPVDEFIAEVIRHIDAIRYEDPETGLQEIKLIRGDYDAETLPVLDPSNADLLHYDTIQVSELTNQVTVTYWDRNRGDDASLTVQDTAAITMAGSITNASIEYPGFSNARNALQAAERDLSQMSRPFARIKIRTTRQAANLKPGDLFVLQDDDLGIAQMVCRVAKRSEKGLLDGSIELEAAEDVFGTALSTYVVPPDSGWVDPVGAPRNLGGATAFEVPYYLLVKTLGESDTMALDPTAGFYAYAGIRPEEGAHVNYGLYAAAEGVPIYPEDVLGSDFTPYAVVDGDLDDPSETLLPVSLISDVESLRPGHVALVGDGPAEETEIIELAVVPEEGDTEIEVVRGVLDTVPRPLADGTRLLFVEAFVGRSPTEYVEGEIVEGHGRPRNGQGEFEEPLDGSDPYLSREIEMAARQYRPYPPANLQLDGHYEVDYPGAMQSPATLTWAHRDRVTQSDHTVSWFDSDDIGPEDGTTYRIEVYGVDGTGTPAATPFADEDLGLVASYELDIDTDPIPGDAASVQFRLWAVRDGYDSLQYAAYTVPVLLPPEIIDIEPVTLFAPEIIDIEPVTLFAPEIIDIEAIED